jgi:uncharacterized protein (DUF488 family)
MKPRVVTIGVYGFSEERFFGALRQAGVDTFCDIRARRGLRGGLYAFANSARLQKRLGEMGIRYLHLKELAPSAEVREAQDKADKASQVGKRKREALSPVFVEAYRRERLAGYDSREFLERVGPDARVVALFCVEGQPQACHRSLVAEKLAEELGVEVEHVTA